MAIWPFTQATPTEDDDTSSQPSSRLSRSTKSSVSGVVRTRSKGDPNDDVGEGQATLNALAAMLEPFQGANLPAKARTDPTIPQKPKEPMTISKLWQYVPFFATQGSSLTKAFVSHHLYGPPKPSWGVELTLFTAFLREAAAYSHLSSLSRLRSVLDLGTFLPTPKDGIVTPISFKVKRRGLRGFLAESDAKEDGKRLVTGEWVINKRLWKKMQGEYARNKVVGKDRVILYLHGGAYYVMSAETHRFLTISVSRYTESRVFAINYRLAPETRFPGQLHDAVSAYMRLIIDLKIPPENIVFAGDSAGGGLCLATMMYLRDEGYPLPSGAVLMSPWVDLTMSCESWTTNQPYDYLPQPKTDDHLHPVKCLLGEEGIHKYLTHPYVSPLFGNFTGLPPLLIQAGDAEVLRDEITLLAHKASLAGCHVEHEIFEDCVHVFQAFLFLEASRKALQSQRQFVKYKLPTLNKPKDVDLAQMDAEITSDAHPVDQQGNAEPTSLPSSPISSSADLPAEGYDTDEGERLSPGATPRDSPGPPTPTTDSPEQEPDVDEEEEESVAPEVGNRATRPILRAYASARDLVMSKATPLSSPTSAPPTSSRRNHARSNTSSSIIMSKEGSSLRPLHSRSSSHPDFRELLEQYETSGPVHLTRVYSVLPAPGGGNAPMMSPPVTQETELRSRSRAPSFAGESAGYGFT